MTTEDTMTDFPELEPHCGSWIVHPAGRPQEMREFFRQDRAAVEALHAAGFVGKTALQHLVEINGR